MARDRNNGTPWILAIAAVALLARFCWLTDMEFKSDERQTVRIIAQYTLERWTPTAPISNHSGLAHSSGFFYFLHYLTIDNDALSVVAWIAALNAIAIIAPLWWLRRSTKYACTFALCATSAALIVGSRKIWTPDLQAAWVCLSIGLVALSLRRSRYVASLLSALAAVFLILAGHMYLPAACVAAVGGLTVLIAYAAARRWWQLAGWIVGSLAGWSTFIPWAIKILSGTSGARAAPKLVQPLDIPHFLSAVRMGLTVSSPYDVYATYLRPNRRWLLIHQPSFWLDSTFFWVAVSTVIGTAVFVAAVWLSLRCWRALIRDPLLLTAFALLLLLPFALFVARLGSYVHYWLAAIPFFYYWMAWGASRGIRIWKWLTVAACVTSLLAAASFINVVHDNGGLRGEYGKAYSAQN